MEVTNLNLCADVTQSSSQRPVLWKQHVDIPTQRPQYAHITNENPACAVVVITTVEECNPPSHR
jgi:hypothetical protein